MQGSDYGAVDQSGITSRQLDDGTDTEVGCTDTEVGMSWKLNTYTFL